MRLDPFPRFPADQGQVIRKLTDLHRDIASQVNGLSEGRISAANNAYTSVPESGSWKAGDFVRNTAPSLISDGGRTYVVAGWMRLTTSATNVLGVDWAECLYATRTHVQPATGALTITGNAPTVS